MDKKTLLGIVLIAVILIGFSWYNETQMKEQQLVQQKIDSLNNANREKEIVAINAQQAAIDSAVQVGAPIANFSNESLKNAAEGNETFYTLENDRILAKISNKGGAIQSVELKKYKTYGGDPLYLFTEKDAKFNLNFFTDQNLNTEQFFFENVTGKAAVEVMTQGQSESLVLRLPLDSVSSIDYIYTITAESNMVDFTVKFNNTAKYISPAQSFLTLQWANISPQQERGFSYENAYTTIAYKYPGENSIEELGFSDASKEENVSTKMEWIAFKQHFFSSVFIYKNGFLNGDLKYETFKPTSGEMKNFSAVVTVPYTPETTAYDFSFYFGANEYSQLKSYDLGLEKLVPLGWGIFGWVNKFIVIPTFNLLGDYFTNYGLIILLLTILIKLLLFPFTYKSYISMAKMRLIKPDIDALNEKFPKKEDAMKKQQAMMELYRKAGVNPLGGCLPMLLQLPILIAMFKFFPASIELRQQSFLWANDLSSYDSIFTLPFDIPFYGSHVSLFALLMGLSLVFSTKLNTQNQASTSQQLPGMNFMMTYVMPIVLIAVFNNYSSGLSYYYLLTNIITIGQMLIIRRFVDDQKLHAQMKSYSAKPRKKSGFQARYEEMVRRQEEMRKQQSNNKKK